MTKQKKKNKRNEKKIAMAMHGASTNKQNGPNEMLIIIIKIYMKIIIHSYIYENKAAGNNF